MTGPVVFITGAARGLGRATAMSFARQGAAVVVTDACGGDAGGFYPMPSEDDLEAVEGECAAAGASAAMRCVVDVRVTAQVEQALVNATTEFGKLDVVVNCAGVIGPAKRADEMEELDWANVLDINLSGPWRCARAAFPLMRKGGSIVNVASTAGLVAFPHFANYVASKHGLIGLTRALALDFAPAGIRVNAVCPTSIEPRRSAMSMLEGVAQHLGVTLEDYRQLSLPNHPLGTLPNDDDVAGLITWLASTAAAKITGAAIPIDSGFTAR